MTYKEFRNHPDSKLPGRWYRVSWHRPRVEDERMAGAFILQWEPSNAKWYHPAYMEGRVETGYVNTLWFRDGRNEQAVIDHIEPLIA